VLGLRCAEDLRRLIPYGVREEGRLGRAVGLCRSQPSETYHETQMVGTEGHWRSRKGNRHLGMAAGDAPQMPDGPEGPRQEESRMDGTYDMQETMSRMQVGGVLEGFHG